MGRYSQSQTEFYEEKPYFNAKIDSFSLSRE